ncbi:hypothetical protein B566_EDAN015127 [Ephemera danica]|nr:hypothetical protein B566_EDAN015127 [Ephemera danica]
MSNKTIIVLDMDHVQAVRQRGNLRMDTLAQLTHDENTVISAKKCCWICLGIEDEDITASWVFPCRCRGTTMWVHQLCVQRWVDEKLQGNMNGAVFCPQCATRYAIELPTTTLLVAMMDKTDNILHRSIPLILAGVVLCSAYCAAFAFGGFTVLQVMGYRDGLGFLETSDPLKLMVSLPAIPVLLSSINFVEWEDYVMHFLRRRVATFPLLGYILPSFRPSTNTICTMEPDFPHFSDPLAPIGTFFCALMMPTVASVCGQIFFESSTSKLQRTFLGGVAFVAGKGILRIHQKQQHYVRLSKRRILDYTHNLPNEAA